MRILCNTCILALLIHEMTKRIYLSPPPHLTGNELHYLKENLKSNWPSIVGQQLQRFSSALSDYINIPQIALANSGISAIHLALNVLGAKKDDIVLTSTFVASVNPITYVGATPILIESESDTWNMSPQFLEDAIKDCLSKGCKLKLFC